MRAWFLSGVLVLGFVANASAVTIDEINANGGNNYKCGTTLGCVQYGDKYFYGFQGPSGTSVDVTGGPGSANTPFIDFGGSFTDVPGNGASDYIIRYIVTSTLGNTITGITQSFAGAITLGNGIFAFTEDVYSGGFGQTLLGHSQIYCNPVTNNSPGDCDYSDPFATPVGEVGGDILTFAPTQTAYVVKDFNVLATSGYIGVSHIIQGFVQTPEPGQMSLLLGVFLMGGLFYRSRKRAQA